LRAAAASRSAWLELLVGAVPAAVVAEVVWSADKAPRRDPAYRSEQLAWSGRPLGATDEIVAGSARLLTGEDDILPMRDFSGATTRTVGRHYESEPVVAVLSSPGDTPHDQVARGVATRLGYGQPGEISPRRPVTEVIYP
jgi:hypothetical protein